MDKTLNQIKSEGKISYIMGDFNINLLNEGTHLPTGEFIENVMAQSFIPLITRPTRITPTSATIIDNIFSNNITQDLLHKGALLVDITDHLPIFCILMVNSSILEERKEYFKQTFNEISQNKFNEELTNNIPEELYHIDDPKESFTLFANIFHTAFNKCFPPVLLFQIILIAGLSLCVNPFDQ